ncbi:hypothetical protein HD554DRAFT_2313932 [Boletus coccyginus]|nr:hypothetical protein HD554DRAFT_2313932 [Boletus coccyginus]
MVKKDAQGLEKKKRLKAEAKEKEARERQERRQMRLEESRKVVLVKDASLPTPTKSKIVNLERSRGQRVRVSGWVHRLRDQQEIMFIVLRDGTGYLASRTDRSNRGCGSFRETTRLTVPRTEPMMQSHCSLRHRLSLPETLKVIPEGQKAPGGHELVVDYWKVLGAAPGAEEAFTNRLNEQSDPSILADLRHLVLRGETAFQCPPTTCCSIVCIPVNLCCAQLLRGDAPMSRADPGGRWCNAVQARLLWTIRVSHSKFPIISRDLSSFAWRRILYSRELSCREQSYSSSPQRVYTYGGRTGIHNFRRPDDAHRNYCDACLTVQTHVLLGHNPMAQRARYPARGRRRRWQHHQGC